MVVGNDLMGQYANQTVVFAHRPIVKRFIGWQREAIWAMQTVLVPQGLIHIQLIHVGNLQ